MCKCGHRFKYTAWRLCRSESSPPPCCQCPPSLIVLPHHQDLCQHLQLRTRKFRHAHRAGGKDKPCVVQSSVLGSRVCLSPLRSLEIYLAAGLTPKGLLSRYLKDLGDYVWGMGPSVSRVVAGNLGYAVWWQLG